MRQRTIGVVAAALVLLGIAGAALLFPRRPASTAGKIDLKILYAGNLGSERERDFTSFLRKHFTKVGTTDYQGFRGGDDRGYDVVIFDWAPSNERDKHVPRLTIPAAPRQFPEDFDRPAILIGAAGGAIAGELDLKVSWY